MYRSMVGCFNFDDDMDATQPKEVFADSANQEQLCLRLKQKLNEAYPHGFPSKSTLESFIFCIF